MRRGIVLICAASLALMAGPALAEPTTPPSDDPIADLLSGVAAEQGMDDDAAESAPSSGSLIGGEVEPADGDAESPTETAPPSPELAPPPAQPTYVAPAPFVPPPPVSRLPQLDRPVMIDELWRTPEAPPTVSEQTYESRIRGGSSAAQGLQGPLDGGWVLRGADGGTLYSLQLVDKGTAGLEGGAFRSLRQGKAGQVGLIDSVDRMADGGIQLRFTPRGQNQPAVITLRPSGGGWSGEIWEAGSTRQVTMRRQ
jgi:hypothetical protein